MHLQGLHVFRHVCSCMHAVKHVYANASALHAAGLARTLRELPSAEAIALRSEVSLSLLTYWRCCGDSMQPALHIN